MSHAAARNIILGLAGLLGGAGLKGGVADSVASPEGPPLRLGDGWRNHLVQPVSSAELYDPVARKWSPIAMSPNPPSTAANREMRVWLLGGNHSATLLAGVNCDQRCGQVWSSGVMNRRRRTLPRFVHLLRGRRPPGMTLAGREEVCRSWWPR